MIKNIISNYYRYQVTRLKFQDDYEDTLGHKVREQVKCIGVHSMRTPKLVKCLQVNTRASSLTLIHSMYVEHVWLQVAQL